MTFRITIAALGLATTLGVSAPVAAQQITGAGATFPAPLYTAWAEAAKAAIGVELNYQAIGSGGGVTQITGRTVDFGASDAPVPQDKLTAANLVQFPTSIGAITPIVNLPGVEANKLKLTGELIAEIYLGKITKWNDPKLVEMNHGMTLPATAIAPVYRADGSGTSFVYTSWLSAVSPEWKDKVGAGTSVKWVAGNGAKGNDGVAATVKQVKGAIGYVETIYASKNNLVTTQLRNKAGAFVTATPEAFASAAGNADWAGAKNYAISLVDEPGPASWPIVSTTFVLVPRDAKDPARTATVLKFFDWAYNNGGATALKLQYLPLPTEVQNAVRKTWATELKQP